MRIAIPVWENKVSPVLDTASRLLIVEIQDNKELSRFKVYLEEDDIARRCHRVRGLGVDVLICGAVSKSFSRMLSSIGVRLISGRSGAVNSIIGAYFIGKLSDSKFLMPGFKATDED
jgi:predicted Fe-Mo cluster-binding NifX family protein